MIFQLVHSQARSRAVAAVAAAPEGYEVRISEPRRSSEQNAKMWAVLADLSAQVEWYGNKLTAKEWKCVITAGLKRQKVVPGVDGGLVAIGSSTSEMSKSEMVDVIEFAHAFGAERGVVWSDTEWRNAE